MSDISAKLGLMLPNQVDPFVTADVRANFEKIDAAPGSSICTSASRPTWSSAQAGRKIYETDTGLEWVWDGAAFKRTAATGLLKRSDGSWAIGERTTNAATSSGTPVIAVGLTNVVVPAGNRPLRIEAAWAGATNPAHAFMMYIFRSNTNNSGPVQGLWDTSSNGADAAAGGGAFYTLERNGLAAGVYNWSLQFRCTGSLGGTNVSTIIAAGGQPITISVIEL